MSSSPTQVAGSAAPRVTNDEVRAVLHTHIRKTAKFIKFLDLCVYCFAWIAAMFGLWLLACIVDHWLAPLSSLGRWLFWISAVVGTAWWFGTQLIPLLFQRINPAYAAKRIEHLLPEFKNGLISWLELDQMPENGVPRGIMSALTYRAARFIGGQDPSTTVDTSRLIKLIGVVLLLFMSLVVYTMVSPKSVLDTGKRIAMPWRSIAAPSRVQILSVKPGAVELTQGKPLEVDVEVRGIRTNEAVRVRFTTTDGQLRDQRVDLTATTEGYRYGGKVRTETTGVEHELDYWVEAGDAISGPYRVSLSPLPSVVLDQVELKFPAYTKIADRKLSGGDFEAVEGTRATIHAIANQRMSRGRWEVNPEIDAAGELIRAESVHELSVDDRLLTGTLLLQLNAEKENPTKLTYRLRGFNQRGDGNREPILHSMKVIADVAPEIKLVGPESRRVKVRPTSRLNLEVQANDPDFGLSQIDIEIRRSGIIVRKESLLKSEGAIGQQIKRLPINMADFKIAEGGTLEVRAFAHDNRHDPVSERLAPNSKESEPLTLEVVGADQEATPDEEQMTAPEPSADGKGGSSERNQDAGSEASKGSQSGNTNNRNTQNNDSNPSNEASESDPSRKNSNPNDSSQEPRQNSTPNPADPNGSSDQGEQKGAQGKQEGKQPNDSNPADGQQKSSSGKSGGQQSGSASGKQDSGKQDPKEQGGQSGSQSGGGENADSGEQSDSSSTSSGKNSTSNNSAGKNSKQNSSTSGQAGNDSSNSGSKSSSPRSNGSKGESSSKSDAGQGGENGSEANNGGDGTKPNDGEVVKRVQEFMQEKNSKPNSDASPAQESKQKGNGSENNSKSENSPNTENNSPPKSDGTGNEGAKSQGAKGEDTKSGSSNSQKNDNPGSKGERPDAPSETGQRLQPNTKMNPNDPTGKQNSPSQSKGSQSKGAENKGSENKSSESAENSQSKGDKNSDGNQANSNTSNSKSSDGKGSDGKGSEGKGSEGKGSEGKGSDGKGSDGKGSEGKGSEAKGSEGKGSEGKGSDGKGSDGKGSDGKGSDGKGSDGKGSEGKGSDGKGSDGKGSDGKGSDGKGSDGKGSDGKGSDGKGSDGKGSDGKGSDGKGSEGKGSEGKGSEGKGSEGKGSEGKGSEGKGSEGKSSSGESSTQGQQASGSQSGKPSGSGEGGGKSNGSQPGPSGNSGSTTKGGVGGGDGKADAANEDYANRTTQMVLDYLNRQKDQPDPELLRELNWTEEDLRRFTERWNRARNLAASPNPDDQKKWKEMLEDLGLNRQMVKPSAASSIDDNFQQMRDSGNRTRPPENLRKQYEAFRRAFEKSAK